MHINTMLSIMEKYNLSADELFFIYLVLISRTSEEFEKNGEEKLTIQKEKSRKESIDYNDNPIYEWLKIYGSKKDKDDKIILRKLFDSLQEKNIISKKYQTTTFNPSEIPFNTTFIKNYFKHSGKLGEELFNNYLPYLDIAGKLYPLRTINKFNGLEEFFFHYSSTIKHNIQKHNEILSLLNWGKQNNLINMGIEKFVASQSWRDLQYMKDNGISNRVADPSSLYLDD